ncbi:DUF1259 domain-containing protein [Streptomyces paludis]|uniref:DUF1259 domain-containing protein n=1 Tax=Streptomyces paludis TaxID=2282738 RepID=A0A345HSH6_9ACTN|nr:DUF1259 domain-containing protein [Streptomyces paludis]AXG79650.1 DUF1259 domain-containing protein [Streptomyces paludis]
MNTPIRDTTPRRTVLTAAALAPVLAGVPLLTARAAEAASAAEAAETPASSAGSRRGADPGHDTEPVRPVPSTLEYWRGVTAELGRPGTLGNNNTAYFTRYPRGDLRLTAHGVPVSTSLALGSHIAFVRYPEDEVLLMGDLTITEGEVHGVLSALQDHGIAQTSLHKHLPAHQPDVWWIHIHAHGKDPVALARGVRAALARTASPPHTDPEPPRPIDLDLDGINAALRSNIGRDGEVAKATFARRETIVDQGMVLPPGLGSISALIFQPLGGGRAALSGDFALIAPEVQGVIKVLLRGGIGLVELHNHGLTENPRLFFIHVWAVGDAVRLAKVLRAALDLTNVVPVSNPRTPAT